MKEIPKDIIREYRFHLIADRETKCPFCGAALRNSDAILTSFFRSHKCNQCNALLSTLAEYYQTAPKYRKQFDNISCMDDIVRDNAKYRIIKEKERQEKIEKWKTQQEQVNKKQEKDKEEKERAERIKADAERRAQIKINKEYGDGPLGNSPKKRIRSLFS